MPLADVLAAAEVRPVTVGFLDIHTDPVRGWTGPGTFAPTGTGDTDLDGFTFSSVEGAVEISDFIDNQDIGGEVTVSYAAGEMADEEVFQQLIVDRRAWFGRRAKFWRFFLAADEGSVGSEFYTLFNGVMVGAGISRQAGGPSVISIRCDQDIQKARPVPPARWIDHQRFYTFATSPVTFDTATSFMNDLGRGGIASGRSDIAPNADPLWQEWYNAYNRR